MTLLEKSLNSRNLILVVLSAQIALSLVQFVSAQPPGNDTRCKPVAGVKFGCVCDHPDGRIDLRPIANKDGTPKYTGLVDPNTYTYSFNPCYTFTTKGLCSNVFACQQDAFEPDAFYDIADGGTEEIYTDKDGKVYLYYTGPSGRTLRVYLTCDKSCTGDPHMTTDGDIPLILQYVFHMRSAYVCPGCGDDKGGRETEVGEGGGTYRGEIVVNVAADIGLSFLGFFMFLSVLVIGVTVVLIYIVYKRSQYASTVLLEKARGPFEDI